MDAAKRLQLTTWLREAEDAYHALMMGRTPKVFVDQNGERVEYSAGSATQLAKYIAELKRQLGMNTVTGPMNVWM